MQPFLIWLFVVAVCLFAVFLLRARFSPRPVFGGLFVLALIPFFCCAFVSFARVHSVVSYADGAGRLDPDNLIQRLHEIDAPFYFGAVLTAVLVGVHLLLCLFTRRGLTTRSSEQRLAVGPVLFILPFLASLCR